MGPPGLGMFVGPSVASIEASNRVGPRSWVPALANAAAHRVAWVTKSWLGSSINRAFWSRSR